MIVQKVKFFHASSPIGLETQVEKWLEENRDKVIRKIISDGFSMTGSSSIGCGYFVRYEACVPDKPGEENKEWEV